MELEEAVEILNKNHHWFGISNPKYTWKIWMDIGHCCGVTITKRIKAKYANDDDVGKNDNRYLPVFDAIAIAEKYEREGHPLDCECKNFIEN